MIKKIIFFVTPALIFSRDPFSYTNVSCSSSSCIAKAYLEGSSMYFAEQDNGTIQVTFQEKKSPSTLKKLKG